MIVALLVLAQASPDPAWNCAQPVAQQEMNWCAAREYERADAIMNRQWSTTAAEMKRRDVNGEYPRDARQGFFATLLDAQRAWLKYRDAQCASEGYLFRGGSMEPLLVSTCRTRLTEERTQQLRYLIEQ